MQISPGDSTHKISANTSHTWQVTGDMWHMTHDMWHGTNGMWHMACDTWHVTHDIVINYDQYLLFVRFKRPNFSNTHSDWLLYIPVALMSVWWRRHSWGGDKCATLFPVLEGLAAQQNRFGNYFIQVCGSPLTVDMEIFILICALSFMLVTSLLSIPTLKLQ